MAPLENYDQKYDKTRCLSVRHAAWQDMRTRTAEDTEDMTLSSRVYEVRGSLLSLDKAEQFAGTTEQLTPSRTPPVARMSTRARVLHTVLIFSTFLGFGLCRGIYGPTLMELRTITSVSLTRISMLFTCLGVGGIAGSLTFGRLFDVFNPLNLFVGALAGVALVTSLIPWLHLLTVMMGACALHSFLYSGLAIGCTVTLFRLWREFSRQIFLSMHLLYTVGGFIAPLLSEPFLTLPKTSSLKDTNSNLTSNSSPTSQLPSHHKMLNITHIHYAPGRGSSAPPNEVGDNRGILLNIITNLTFTDDGAYTTNSSNTAVVNPTTSGGYHLGLLLARSRIVFTYLIIGIYLLAVAIGMFCLLLYMRNQKTGSYWREGQPRSALPCQLSLFRLLATILFMLYNFNFGGQETVYSGLLFTFAVEHVGFSQTRGSLLVSMLYTAHTAGRFLVIIVSHWVPNALYILLCSVIGCGVSCVILTHYTTTNVPAVWSATVIAGLSVSTMYTMGLLWAKDFLPITAAFTSLYTIAYTGGMMLWPPLTSYFMKTRGSAWFAYMNVILLMNYSIAIVLLFMLQRCRRRFRDSDIPGDDDIGRKIQQRADDDLIAHSMHSLHAV